MSSLAEIETILNECIRLRMLVKIVYQKPEQAFTTDRLIEAYDISLSSIGSRVVEAVQIEPKINGAGFKKFRLDRIVGAEHTGVVFTPRAGKRELKNPEPQSRPRMRIIIEDYDPKAPEVI